MTSWNRYALYFAPAADSALWRFGCETLGYDGASGADVPQWCPPGFTPEDWLAATEDPRTYGFHATLKAPFRLAPEREEAELIAFLAAFGRSHAAGAPVVCEVGVAGASPAGGFIAVIPAAGASTTPFAALEQAIVREFDPFRAPLVQSDIARRMPARLTPSQREQLDRWGYPYCLADFSFHMSLTGRLADPQPVAAALRQRAEASGAAGPIAIDRLALFRQEPGKRFRIIADAALKG